MQGKTSSLKLFLATGLVSTFLVLVPLSASAQDYPNKPITIYVGYGVGGTTDLIARAIATGAEKMLGVPVLVENKTGAAGTVAASLLATKKPDGYSLAVVDSGTISTTTLLLRVNYDPQKDFTPIMQANRLNAGIVVNSDSPIKNAEDFIAYAKAHPGMSYSHSGTSSVFQIAAELFAHSKGLKFKHIPYEGGAQASVALLGKHCDFHVGTGSHIPYVLQGKFRLIAVVTTDKRDPEFPNIPTLTEIGSEDLPAIGNPYIGPKGMPDAIVNKLNVTFKKIVEAPDFQALLRKLHQPYEYKDGAQLAKDLPAMTERYKRALNILGITLQKK